MRVGVRLLGATLLAWLACPGPAAAAEIWTRSSGQWTVKLFQAPGDRAWCSWDTRFRASGRTVSFMINGSGLHLFVGATDMRLDRLRGERATIQIGPRRYPVTFGFGTYNETSRSGSAAGVIATDSEGTRDFIIDFARASTASVRFASGVTWDIGLRGTAASLAHMQACTAEMRQRNGGGFAMDPTERRAPPPQSLDPTQSGAAPPQPSPRGGLAKQ